MLELNRFREAFDVMSEVKIRVKKNKNVSFENAVSDSVEEGDIISGDVRIEEDYETPNEFDSNSLSRIMIEYFKYFAIVSLSFIYWEILMGIVQGGFSFSNLFFLFFIPAESAFLTALHGIANEKIARITLPIIQMLPPIYYIAQTIYFRNFGSLFSISMAGMGNDAVGNFGWAVLDAVEGAIFIFVLILIPVFVSIFFAIKNVLKLTSYKWWMHFVTILMSVALWLMGVLCVRAFGNDRLSPYYLLTNSTATTDSAAKKLGVVTTAIVESGTYYFGIGSSESEFVYEEEEDDFEEIAAASTSNQIAVEIPKDVAEAAGIEAKEEVERLPWINDSLDLKAVAEQSNNKENKGVAEFVEKRGPSTTNEYTGMFEGYNLIYICAESFWSYACNEKVTPTLYKMANNGIVLNNYYNSFYNTTTNGEFAFCTSLWPDVSRNSKNGTDVGSFAQSSTKYMPQGLGDLFTANGVPAYAFHNYYGKYYRRILSWPNLGYKCRFTGDKMWFTSNWPSSDYELMQQTVDDYINDDQFHAYYMTFSGHGPYTAKNYMFNKNIGAVTSIIGEDSMNLMARGFLAGELELDKAMEYLLDRLEEAGKLDNTVIVLTGDHYPYYLDSESRNSLVGFDMDENFDIYHSTCIVYNAGIKEPIQIDDYCCNVDIAPTMLNMFNIPFDSRLMMGRDIFSQEAHKRATLYNMSFVSDLVSYNYETGTAKWTAKGNELTQEQKDKYINSQLNAIENEYNASCKIIHNNFFFDSYKLSGLLDDKEISDELAREAAAQAQDDTYNLEDEEEQAAREAERLLLEQQQAIEAGLIPPGLDPNAPIGDGTAIPNVEAGDGTVPAPAPADGGAVPNPVTVDPALAQ